MWTVPLVALLTACGGGSDSTDTSTTGSTVTASVIKGPVDGAACGLYSISVTGEVGSLISSATSAAGLVSFSLADTGGSWLIQCTGGTYTDEATGTTQTAPQLRAVVNTVGDVEVAVTPLTELAVATATDLNNVDNGMIAEAFGLGSIDITKVIPTDLNSETAGADSEGDYGQVLAMLSQYLEDQSLSLSELIDDFTEALDDGAFTESEKTALADAADNLATSSVSGSLNTERLNTVISDLEQIIDSTPPVVSFSPASLTLLVNESGQTTVSVEDGVLENVSCNSQAVSYIAGTVSASQAGSFECTAIAYDANQQQGQATLSLTISEPPPEPELNTAPVANAGADSNIPTGAAVALDGSASSDADGDALSYSWVLSSKPNGSSTSLSNANTVSPSFVSDVEGVYQLTLTVSDGTDTSNDAVSVTASTNSWLINTSVSGTYIDALINVQGVSTINIGPNQFTRISTSGVPDYEVLMTQADVEALNARPKAASDFVGGMTSAQAGDQISFGEDIGYNIIHQGCALGYWPPGPMCPSDQQRQANIPVAPAPASTECDTNVNAMGLMLNGTSIFNWSDGGSYANQGVWEQLAPEFEIYDVDICNGHAQQQGDYHHHMFSSCLASLFSDDGQSHSPIYGYAADGYPVYGPHHAKDTLAKSAWVKRNYAEVSEGGCGDGTRSCLLVDPYDLSKGVSFTNYPGPDTDEVVSSNSGNTFIVTSGYYFQDYYYDATLTAQGGAYLDEHNGHSHDGFGYHYHSTVEQDNDGKLTPAFPYNIGPTFYGETPGGSIYTCQALP